MTLTLCNNVRRQNLILSLYLVYNIYTLIWQFDFIKSHQQDSILLDRTQNIFKKITQELTNIIVFDCSRILSTMHFNEIKFN